MKFDYFFVVDPSSIAISIGVETKEVLEGQVNDEQEACEGDEGKAVYLS